MDFERDALWLARLSVHEAGWTHLRDVDGIHAVVANTQREGEPYLQAMHRRTGYRLLTRSTDRLWALHLQYQREAPLHWVRLPWAGRYRARFGHVLDRARQAVTGQGEQICPRAPIAWGGRMDSAGFRQRGWVKLDCGETKNGFWGLP
jgi:hypothetical protein